MNEQDAALNGETHMGEKSDNKDECAARLSKRVGSWGGGARGGHLAEGFCAFMLEVGSSESRRGRAARARRTTVSGKRAGTGVQECREGIGGTTGEK